MPTFRGRVALALLLMAVCRDARGGGAPYNANVECGGTGLAFVARPLAWQTAWIRGAVAVLLVAGGAGGVAWMVRARHRRLERAARELRESEARFRLVVETAPSGMVMVDAGGRIAMVNAMVEKTFGYPRHELVGRSIEMIFPDRAHDGIAVRPGRRPATDGDGNGNRDGNGDGRGHGGGMAHRGDEIRGRRADGRGVPVEIQSNPIDTPEGRFTLLCVTDVSERERAELQAAQLRNELAHLSRVTMLGELSGSLAHELNQPLTSILSNAQAAEHFLAIDRPDLRELREILKDIVSEDKRAGEVIRRLRALFKKGDVQRQPLDLNELLQDVLKLARSDLIDRGVSVNVRLSPGLPPVIGDRVQLQQVLLNVVKNGCDAMEGAARAERRLDVSSAEAPDGTGVRVSMRDFGCGVAPGEVERVFEPFFTTKSSGMGLGLAVCRTIVQTHGGRLWIENCADRGATVHLVMPAARDGSGAKGRDETKGARGAGGALDQSPIVAGRGEE